MAVTVSPGRRVAPVGQDDVDEISGPLDVTGIDHDHGPGRSARVRRFGCGRYLRGSAARPETRSEE